MIVNKIKFLFFISKIPHSENSQNKLNGRKNHPTLSKQVKNILIKFRISTTFRSIEIKLKVVNIKISMGGFPIDSIHTAQHKKF